MVLRPLGVGNESLKPKKWWMQVSVEDKIRGDEPLEPLSLGQGDVPCEGFVWRFLELHAQPLFFRGTKVSELRVRSLFLLLFFRHFFCHRRWSDEWNNILAELASFDCVYDSALWACMLAWWIRVCLDGERCCLCRNYWVDTCCQVSARLAVASRVPLPWRSRSLPSYLCCRGSPLGVAASSEQC